MHTYIPQETHPHTIISWCIFYYLFHLHLEYFVLCIYQVQEEQQITMHRTITAFKASTYVFILLCTRSMLCRSSANRCSTNVLGGSLYCHHFLLLQLTSSWCCHCCIQFHKAIQTGALITTPVLLIVIAWPICDFLEDRCSLTCIKWNLIKLILKGASRCNYNTKYKSFSSILDRSELLIILWGFAYKVIWISNQFNFPPLLLLLKKKVLFYVFPFNNNIKELRKTNFALGRLCRKTFHFKQGTTQSWQDERFKH